MFRVALTFAENTVIVRLLICFRGSSWKPQKSQIWGAFRNAGSTGQRTLGIPGENGTTFSNPTLPTKSNGSEYLFNPFPNSLHKWGEVGQWNDLTKWNGKFRSAYTGPSPEVVPKWKRANLLSYWTSNTGNRFKTKFYTLNSQFHRQTLWSTISDH